MYTAIIKIYIITAICWPPPLISQPVFTQAFYFFYSLAVFVQILFHFTIASSKASLWLALIHPFPLLLYTGIIEDCVAVVILQRTEIRQILKAHISR